MDSASPPVSPTVVAQIFTIQKASVTRGTLLWTEWSVVVIAVAAVRTRPPPF